MLAAVTSTAETAGHLLALCIAFWLMGIYGARADSRTPMLRPTQFSANHNLSCDPLDNGDGLCLRRFHDAVELLLQASRYARLIGVDRWEFAVNISCLNDTGLSENDLRLLVRLGDFEHAFEITSSTDTVRRFQHVGSTFFTDRTCFVLSAHGELRFSEDMALAEPDAITAPHMSLKLSTHFCPERTPSWDSDYRVLTFDGKVVKEFRWLAANQEAVLNAFQEEHWPKRILDPLCPQVCQVTKRRLGDTIKYLNRGHVNKLIRFRGDGTGEGVCWEAVS